MGVCTYPTTLLGEAQPQLKYRPVPSVKSHRAAFEEHQARYGKHYASREEEELRFEVFVANSVYVRKELHFYNNHKKSILPEGMRLESPSKSRVNAL